MTRAALESLLAKVEAGTLCSGLAISAEDASLIRGCFPTHDANDVGAWELVSLIMCEGSLDAAKALHEAVLPGWVARPQIGGEGAGVSVWHCTIEDWDGGDEISANNQPDPARAWLIAIIRAMLAEGE